MKVIVSRKKIFVKHIIGNGLMSILRKDIRKKYFLKNTKSKNKVLKLPNI